MTDNGSIDEVFGPSSPDDALELPDVLAVLPLREATAFPNTIIPLNIGRPKTLKLVNDVLVDNKVFGLFSQKQAEVEDPTPDDIYRVGTAARGVRMLRMPDGGVRVLAQGLMRVEIQEYVQTEPYLMANVKPLLETEQAGVEVEAVIRNVRAQFSRIVTLSPYMSQEMEIVALNIDEPGRLADFVSSSLGLETSEKQALLEENDGLKRLETASTFLQRELELLQLSSKIQSDVQGEVTKLQKEHFLRMQMDAIKKELGEEDESTRQVSELKQKIDEAQMPEDAEKEALRELERLSHMHPSSAEHSVVRTYLDWLTTMPWQEGTKDRLDIKHARKILDEDHFDLEQVKERILEFLAVRKLRESTRGPILCFVGPPGVGKTSLGKSIARAMGRKFIRSSLGGIRDEAEIRGHRRTYVGALPGRIIQGIRKVGSNNPVFMLDEVDKLGVDFRGDPSSALLEVLDPEQNFAFTDNYLDVPFDLSRVMFICTANIIDTIPPALRDRMERIEIPGYVMEDKIEIARRHLVPRQLGEHGLGRKNLNIANAALKAIIRDYTREAGVRNLERSIASICRKAATKIVEGTDGKLRVNDKNLVEYLGKPKFFSEVADRTRLPGVATGLAWTPYGGEILFVESTAMPSGKGGLVLTGQLGDVMKESAQAALSYLRTHSDDFGIEPDFFDRHDIHIHVPAGAVPKDGPSAGVAMAVSLMSLLTDRAVRARIAMTGEITLRGKVLPVGGIKEKALAAKRASIKTIILPEHNRNDVEEIPESQREGITFQYVDSIDDVLTLAFPKSRSRRKAATRKN
jgi:ATP-dependent Lon protease